MAFNATVENGIIIWDEIGGLTGPIPELFKIMLLLNNEEISPFVTGPTLKLEEKNPYAVVWAINQVSPDAFLGGSVPDFADIVGDIDPDAIY